MLGKYLGLLSITCRSLLIIKQTVASFRVADSCFTKMAHRARKTVQLLGNKTTSFAYSMSTQQPGFESGGL